MINSDPETITPQNDGSSSSQKNSEKFRTHSLKETIKITTTNSSKSPQLQSPPVNAIGEKSIEILAQLKWTVSQAIDLFYDLQIALRDETVFLASNPNYPGEILSSEEPVPMADPSSEGFYVVSGVDKHGRRFEDYLIFYSAGENSWICDPSWTILSWRPADTE